MKVLIQRTYEFDPATQPEIQQAIEVFAANGFEVYGIEPVTKTNEAGDIVERIMSRARIRPAAVSRMLGVTPEAVRGWRRGDFSPNAANLDKLRSLDRSLASRSPHEIAALAEGASLAGGGQPRRSRVLLSDSDRQEIVSLHRDGARLPEIAAAYRASVGTVRRIVSLDKDATTGV